MPKVIINEIDQSRYVAPGQTAPMVVLVPGTASFGPVFTTENPQVITFAGKNDLNRFYKTFGFSPATVTTENGIVKSLDGDLSFEYATNLINKGAVVKFYKVNEGKQASDTEEIISAKHSGKFGNYLVVNVVNVGTESKPEFVVSVYRKTDSTKNLSKESELAALELLENYRVSSDPASDYYENLDKFEYVTFDASKLSDGIFNLSGGLDFADNSGTAVSEEAITTLIEKAVADSFASFKDPYLFDFDFVTSGGFIDSSISNSNTTSTAAEGETTTGDDETDPTKSINKEMISLCESRGDAVALLDTPEDWTYDKVSTYSQGIDNSFAAIYAPWCSSVSVSTGRTRMLPPSFNFLLAILYGMSQSTVENQLWYVPAGVNRAPAPFIVNPKYEIGSVILNKFQNDLKWKVNPIMKVRNYGYCVYGNSTCLQTKSGVGRSALESMNVRLLANVVKKAIFATCAGLAFEYNDSRLWTKFYAKMDSVLIYMKRHFGLYDYKIIMNDTTVTTADMNNRRVPGKIKISPQLAGEFFDIDFEIAPSGVSFNEEAN